MSDQDEEIPPPSAQNARLIKRLSEQILGAIEKGRRDGLVSDVGTFDLEKGIGVSCDPLAQARKLNRLFQRWNAEMN